MKTNHSVLEYHWQHVFVFNYCAQTKHVEIHIMSTVGSQRTVHNCWPWEDPGCRETPLLLWHSSHMFPIWSTKPPFYVWNGAERNSALDGMWSAETRPDGTPSDRLSGQSQTLLTETQLIEDSRPYSIPPVCFLGFPACHDAAVAVGPICVLSRECTESWSCIKVGKLLEVCGKRCSTVHFL